MGRESGLDVRCEMSGLSRSDFLAALDDDDGTAGPLPAWGDVVDRAFEAWQRCREELPARTGAHWAFAHPFVAWIYESARAASVGSPGLIEPAALGLMEQTLRLVTDRVLALEMNARLLGDRLKGASTAERIEAFTAELGTEEGLWALYTTYPVLPRVLATAARQAIDVVREALDRFTRDRAALVAIFGDRLEGEPIELRPLGGDRHRSGRQVLALRFASGLQLVYKPVQLHGMARFQDFLIWLGEAEGLPELRPLKVLTRDDYGWLEFVEHGPCDSAADFPLFYRRMGVVLAAAHVLSVSDLHYENVIASGPHPCVIDLECLMVPPGPQGQGMWWQGPADDWLNDSVLATGLLPTHGGGSQGTPSGWAALPEGSKLSVPQLVDEGLDAPRIEERLVDFVNAQHVPFADGQLANPMEHWKAMRAAYAIAYRHILSRRAEVAQWIERFSDIRARVVFRDSREYGKILNRSLHPECLSNAINRDYVIDYLWRNTAGRLYLRRLTPAESADIWRGDIPWFSALAGKRSIFTADGEELEDLFDKSGVSRALDRLERMNEADLDRQLNLIDSSIECFRAGQERILEVIVPPLLDPDDSRNRDPAAFVAVAAECLDVIRSQAVHRDGSVGWIGLVPHGARGFMVTDVRCDLYSGNAGIALFLAHAGRVIDQPDLHALAREALTPVLHMSRNAVFMPSPIGLFEGPGGLVYALAHLAALWDEPDLAAEARGLTARLLPLVKTTNSSDVIGGLAGLMAAMRALDVVDRSGLAVEVAATAADRLAEIAVESGECVYWPGEDGNLTGISHGAAGIAMELAWVGHRTRAERHRVLARRALAFERAHFQIDEAGEENWADNRAGAVSPGRYWCSGAPGIGQARLACLQWLPEDAHIRVELDAAVRTTRQFAGRLGSDCLCHGNVGNLLFLQDVARARGDVELEREARRVAASLAAAMGAGARWRWGTPGVLQTPGLMLGLAGIGLAYLRLSGLDRVPNPLGHEPPASTHA
ncbi:type 2 lanthipeptide synthetase LanM family protein [Nannocystis radixulma]|uniref:Type 2 lanthipeptide synthetase LanM family protein n=1 Tax=Nannocystis radixulma TaxID=2995305 RepID=A0ABT5BF53_9BACT|nr:type 2 lanthipeptide synthetase LanM family protein [Nannocystis radixulma]MDC0672149.1 type 2 lanthipeptide synthetase LanM family protein [Nannocystis radixulma]